MDLSIIIPILNEQIDIALLISELKCRIPSDVNGYEIIVVVDGDSTNGTVELANSLGTIVAQQEKPGYGGALQTGFDRAHSEYILTLDADLSHSPSILTDMWEVRTIADVVIASRYVPGGVFQASWWRKFLSHVLSAAFRYSLSLPIKDVSSGYRLYNSNVLRSLSLKSIHFDILEEILIRTIAGGHHIIEVPFHYYPRRARKSHISFLKFGWAYLKTFLRMWQLRNSIDSADYDYRAFDSKIPLQRYWQRKRYDTITRLSNNVGPTLDVGCGSSRILLNLDSAIGIDVQEAKVRYMKHYGADVAVASAFALPFSSGSFDCLICSQVIEHIPADPVLFAEMHRVLRPGGILIIGTPDYGGIVWPVIEFFYAHLAPGGYADEHITHYTRLSLQHILEEQGFRIEEIQYVVRAELIMRCIRLPEN